MIILIQFHATVFQLYMFNHHKTRDELIVEINKMLNEAKEEEIRLAYKILSGVLS